MWLTVREGSQDFDSTSGRKWGLPFGWVKYTIVVDRELIDTYPTLERCEAAAEEGAMIMMQAFPFDPDTVIFVCSMSEV